MKLGIAGYALTFISLPRRFASHYSCMLYCIAEIYREWQERLMESGRVKLDHPAGRMNFGVHVARFSVSGG